MTEYTVYLALGSNVGDSKGYIKEALTLLGQKLTNVRSAPLYVSKAVGYTDQADFYNTAAYAETNLDPHELLALLKSIEEQVGRIERFRWGPREIDIDLVFYDNEIVESETLTVPHPRFAERDFVLRPLCDIAPTYIDPKSGKTIQQLLHDLGATETDQAQRLDD